MKIWIIICSALFFSYLKAQDTLYFKNSDKMAVVLLEVNPDNLKYKRFDNQAGATYTVLKSEVSYVTFKNGTKEYFNQTNVTAGPKETPADSATNSKKQAGENMFAGDRPDTLFFRSGKISEVKILIVNDKEVRYKLFNFQDGPTYQASKYELSQARFGNGKVQNFNDDPARETTTAPAGTVVSEYSAPSPGTSQSLYQKGKSDAERYYKHNGGAIGTGCAAAGCGPLWGLIPAVIITNTEPQPQNLGMPNSSYSQTIDYKRGYNETAYKIKKKKVWNAYGIGSGIFAGLVIGMIILSSI